MFAWIDRALRSAAGKVDNAVATWVHALIHGLYLFLSTIFGDVGKAWDDLVKDGELFLSAVDVLGDTVYDSLHDLYTWVNKWGKELVGWIEHPSTLVDFLWDDLLVKIENEAWTAGEKLGKFFLSLMLHNLKRFATLLEDILDAVL
jgi:hypothetical protein